MQHKVTLNQFIAHRLGSSQDAGVLLRTMFSRSFSAGSLGDFWRYWNPVYGYYLLYYCYRPLSRFLPPAVCSVLTFFASGFFLHDLPFGWWLRVIKLKALPIPFVGLWFTLMGIITVIAEALKLNWVKNRTAVRIAINTSHIVVTFALAQLILLQLAR